MFDDIIKEKNNDIVSIAIDMNTGKVYYDGIDDTPDPEPEFTEECRFDWGEVGDNPFADARYTMMEYFAIDEGLEKGYIANIAMFLNDRCGITDHEERNRLARELMNLLWG